MNTKAKLIASLKIWVVIYPSITLFLYLFGERLSVLELYQRTFLLTVSLVPWIVFVGMPFTETPYPTFFVQEIDRNKVNIAQWICEIITKRNYMGAF